MTRAGSGSSASGSPETVKADVLVVADGLLGLATAFEIARRGASTVLVTVQTLYQPWLVPGLVAAQARCFSEPEPARDLTLLSRSLYPEWIESIETESGLACDFDVHGVYVLARTDEEEVALDRGLDWQRRRSLHFDVLSGEEAAEREAGLHAPGISAAFAFSGDGQVDPERLFRSLRLAAGEAGVRVFETGFVGEFSPGPAATWKVETPGRVFLATALVHAIEDPFARSASPFGPALPVVPAVFLDLDTLEDPVRVSRALVAPGAACLPLRSGGVRIVGGGENPDGRLTAGEITRLLEELASFLPRSRGYGFVSARSRLLSFSPDLLPLAGESSQAGGFVAAGLGLDTVLLLPALSSLLADLLTGKKPPISGAAFSPLRLGR